MIDTIVLLLSAALTVSAADTSRYIVLNHGRPAGEVIVVRGADSLLVRYGHRDRNRGLWLQNRYRFARAAPVMFESRALTPAGDQGNVQEHFEMTGDSARLTLGGLASRLAVPPGAYYRVRNLTVVDQALLARFLLAQPQQRATLVPGGSAHAEVVGESQMGPVNGRLVAIHTGSTTPNLVWLDDQGELLASDAGWFITVRPDVREHLPILRLLEQQYRERLAAELAKRLTPAPAPVLAITNADVFDSERALLLPRTTILVRGDRISAVGPTGSVAIPAGARIINAAGKTVLPGFWDMHGHTVFTSQTSGALSQLAAGITTVRDLAGDLDAAVSQRDRAAANTIVSPRIILAGFLEGPGAWAGPTEAIAGSEAEARAWIARYDSLGYQQIKLYNLIHPDLVPAIAAETHARGMRLSGHVPRGLSVPAAVQLGFDEINHGAFLFSTFFQDSLYLPQMRAYSAVAAAVAPHFDVDSAPMTALIDLLKQRRTVIDGTFHIWAGPSALNPNPDAAARNYLRLIKRLYDAGVPLVPGTDDLSGVSYHRELQIYERAGIPAAHVLQLATIGSARVMKQDRDYGSIAAGKVADLVIVAGRPTERLSDLSGIETVVRAGRPFGKRELLGALTAAR